MRIFSSPDACILRDDTSQQVSPSFHETPFHVQDYGVLSNKYFETTGSRPLFSACQEVGALAQE
jgi:hypothetical protein